jgi:Domain of unknown function (DUF4396)
VAPGWLTITAWLSIAAGLVSAAAILYDIYWRGRRQPVRVMEAVWPITALYTGPLGWFIYARLGRLRLVAASQRGQPREPRWRGAFISATHCGAGCMLGDIIGESTVFAGSWAIAGAALWPEYIVDFTLAWVLGILFQYFAIKPMSGLAPRQALARAIRADTLTVVAFEVGLFGWMALMFFVFFPHPHLTPDYVAYWLMMQIGMMIGLATSYPVNVVLIRDGVKHAMHRPVLAAAAES